MIFLCFRSMGRPEVGVSPGGFLTTSISITRELVRDAAS